VLTLTIPNTLEFCNPLSEVRAASKSHHYTVRAVRKPPLRLP
jgi:superfamily II RNA helicase